MASTRRNSVRALRSAIETTDGMIMVSPEYNHGMSGVLKNSLDWASRPYGRSVLRVRPVLTMTGLARLHCWRARAAANERDAHIDPGTPCAPAPDRNRGRA
jgi:NAD(P)H-dependent FMN reductase